MQEQMKRCPFCAEEILAAAVKCKHCGSMLTGASPAATPARVTVTGIDPFAEYRTPIAGKSKGDLTGVGLLGIVLGGGIITGGVAMMSTGDMDRAMSAFMTVLFGIGVAIASYLWARRAAPEGHRR